MEGFCRHVLGLYTGKQIHVYGSSVVQVITGLVALTKLLEELPEQSSVLHSNFWSLV